MFTLNLVKRFPPFAFMNCRNMHIKLLYLHLKYFYESECQLTVGWDCPWYWKGLVQNALLNIFNEFCEHICLRYKILRQETTSPTYEFKEQENTLG